MPEEPLAIHPLHSRVTLLSYLLHQQPTKPCRPVLNESGVHKSCSLHNNTHHPSVNPFVPSAAPDASSSGQSAAQMPTKAITFSSHTLRHRLLHFVVDVPQITPAAHTSSS